MASCGRILALTSLAQTQLRVYFLYLMEFEFDPVKSASNLRKYGIDFLQAQSLWQDPRIGFHHDSCGSTAHHFRQKSTR